MSDFQSKYYLKAWERDIEKDGGKKGSGYYRDSRQASLFVFPNGTWGREGFEKYVHFTKSNKLFAKKRKSRYNWKDQQIHKELRANGIKALSKYSCKYASTCNIISNAIKENKNRHFW